MPCGESSLYIGTSGWAYREWHGRWYPRSLPRRAWLSFYAEHFQSLELNTTFYALPPPERFRQWAQTVGASFRFAVKAPRALTHERPLQYASPVLDAFLRSIGVLGVQLGPILWQLPPQLSCDLERLREFLSALPPMAGHAIEFRHPSWDTPATWELLCQHGVAVVWSSSRRYPCFCRRTAPFLYLRFHGLEGGYAHRYTEPELSPWAERVAEALQEGYPVYAYFNNTAGTAPEDALRFRELIGRIF